MRRLGSIAIKKRRPDGRLSYLRIPNILQHTVSLQPSALFSIQLPAAKLARRKMGAAERGSL